MLKRWRRRLVVALPVALLVVYFAYHAVYGRLGVLAWRTLQAEVQEVEAELRAVEAHNRRLAAAIEGLRPETLDLDVVETALRGYGYVRPEERIILLER
ncbi:MAG: FtsB family cell division protein [Pseudomonadota bacterium]